MSYFTKRRLVTFFFSIAFIGVAVWQFGIESRSRYYDGVRHPYLQAATTDGVTIRWRTGDKVKGWVRYGKSSQDLKHQVVGNSNVLEHVIKVSNLQADRRYYYSVGQGDRVIAGGKDGFWFRTLPQSGRERPVRVWAVGDIGHVPEGATKVRQGAWKWLQQNKRQGHELIDAWITLGDNSGHTGTNQEFQNNFFDLFSNLLRSYTVWPVIGNHDGRSRAYRQVFSPPQDGESGGTPSKTYKYYSFDVGLVHFIALDSQVSFRWGTERMLEWLKQDLANNRLPWTIAYWHHPPYTKASHDSDSLEDSRGRMYWVREKILPLLEDEGVDLVLSGHSHSYERSYLLAGHYGSSDTFKSGMILNRGDGREDGDGSYSKPVSKHPLNFGTVYVVAGSASKVNPGVFDHPAMVVGMERAGSMVLDIDGNRLDARFIGDDSTVLDHFTLTKDKQAYGFESD